MADGVPLLAELVSEVLTVTTEVEILLGVWGEIHSRLSLKHLDLALQPSAIVLSRTLVVVVHPLDVGHEIGKMGSLHC